MTLAPTLLSTSVPLFHGSAELSSIVLKTVNAPGHQLSSVKTWPQSLTPACPRTYVFPVGAHPKQGWACSAGYMCPNTPPKAQRPWLHHPRAWCSVLQGVDVHGCETLNLNTHKCAAAQAHHCHAYTSTGISIKQCSACPSLSMLL